MLADYPTFSDLTLDQHTYCEPLLKKYNEGLSEFTFANLYLFRHKHQYQISKFQDEVIILSGNDAGQDFFVLPTALPPQEIIDELFERFQTMKLVSESKKERLLEMGYQVYEDRDNFDYLYLRQDLVKLPGKRFHKKRNLIQGFLNKYICTGEPLLLENIAQALAVLENWQVSQGEASDYNETKEALLCYEKLKLCGAIYFIKDIKAKPVAFVIGEPLIEDHTYVIHFEKADNSFKGIYQFINKAFASALPKKYIYLNREQDLGDEGLRQAKMTYRPISFIKKYRAKLNR